MDFGRRDKVCESLRRFRGVYDHIVLTVDEEDRHIEPSELFIRIEGQFLDRVVAFDDQIDKIEYCLRDWYIIRTTSGVSTGPSSWWLSV